MSGYEGWARIWATSGRCEVSVLDISLARRTFEGSAATHILLSMDEEMRVGGIQRFMMFRYIEPRPTSRSWIRVRYW